MRTIDAIVDACFALERAIHEHCGYREDWRRIPLEDRREMYWEVDAAECQWCRYAETLEQLQNAAAGKYYLDEIYTQRFLSKWVYRGELLTIVCCNPRADGNYFLRVFDNAREVR